MVGVEGERATRAVSNKGGGDRIDKKKSDRFKKARASPIERSRLKKPYAEEI